MQKKWFFSYQIDGEIICYKNRLFCTNKIFVPKIFLKKEQILVFDLLKKLF